MHPSATVDELLCQSERLEAAGIEFLSGDAPGVRLHPKRRK
jgi:hypothetical protein